MRRFYFILFFVFFGFGLSAQNTTLIKNVNVWDGTGDKLNNGVSVLIENNLIKQVAATITVPNGATIIDSGGKTLIPGLSDAHVHLSSTLGNKEVRNDVHWMYTSIRTTIAAENFLMWVLPPFVIWVVLFLV